VFIPFLQTCGSLKKLLNAATDLNSYESSVLNSASWYNKKSSIETFQLVFYG